MSPIVRQPYGATISGVGWSSIGRALFRDPLELAIEGCLAAMDDAGVSRTDIDGISSYVSGEGSVGSLQIHDALGLSVDWFSTNYIGPSQLSPLFEAIMAVETGRVRHALVFHASCEGSARKAAGSGGTVPGSADEMPERVSGMLADFMPFGAPSLANVISIYARRHFHEYGTTREQMAQIALVERANAGRNPAAIYTDPISLDDYFAARMISEPFCLLDCDVPIDFCTATIVSRDDSITGLARIPVRIDAYSAAAHSRSSLSQFDDLTTMILRDAAQTLWSRTDLKPEDVDLAELYDGFSWLTMAWLEALGFCGKGESGPFIEGGARIALDGELPINTNGGQLSAGRMHGWGYVPEACVQLWGEAGDRQVGDNPEVAVVGCGGGIFGGALLLTKG